MRPNSQSSITLKFTRSCNQEGEPIRTTATEMIERNHVTALGKFMKAIGLVRNDNIMDPSLDCVDNFEIYIRIYTRTSRPDMAVIFNVKRDGIFIIMLDGF